MKGLRTALCLVVILVAATGFAQKITTDWDHGTDFTKYKTYTFAKGTPVENPLMDQRVVDAIEAALAKEGIKKVDENPDMYVTYHASAKENKQYVTDNFGYGYGARWGVAWAHPQRAPILTRKARSSSTSGAQTANSYFSEDRERIPSATSRRRTSRRSTRSSKRFSTSTPRS